MTYKLYIENFNPIDFFLTLLKYKLCHNFSHMKILQRKRDEKFIYFPGQRIIPWERERKN